MAKITANNIQSGAITLDKLDSSVAGNLAAANDANTIATIATSVAVAAFQTANNNANLLANSVAPLITTIQIADASYNVLDDTAANTTGGFIVITGSGFTSNSTVIIGSNVAPSVTFVSSTQIRAQTPALTAASYPVYVVNSNGGTAIKPNGLTTSSFPAWSTDATLDDWSRNWPTAVNLNATSDSNLTYANTSVLPDGTTLLANGYFFGTASPGANTLYTFDVRVTDAELQDAIRTFTVSAVTLDVRRLWVVGAGTNGKTGLDDSVNRSSPVQIGSGINWLSSSTGPDWTLAMKTNGTLWSWGRNNNGQLGQNDTVDRSRPTQIGTDTNWLNAVAAGYSCIAVKTNGTLWTWGSGSQGQNGRNSITNFSSPVQVGSLTTWTSKISGGIFFSAAIKSDGTMWSWGQNHQGQLGLNNILNRSSPTQIGSNQTWRDVVVGTDSFYPNLMAVTTAGTLWMAGGGTSGQLGINVGGGAAFRSSPVQIAGSTWNLFSTNRALSAATRTNGTLWTWGIPFTGALGTSTSVYRSSPVQVGALTNWNGRALSCAYPGVAAIKSDGTLWRFGGPASQGALGLNDAGIYRSSPVQVGTNTNWISLGGNFASHWTAMTLY